MPWTSIAAIYFVLWWVVLFTVLPWGIRSQEESGEVARGTDPGAPAIPHLGAKLAWTTALSAAVFAACYWAYARKLVDLDTLATLWGLLR